MARATDFPDYDGLSYSDWESELAETRIPRRGSARSGRMDTPLVLSLC